VLSRIKLNWVDWLLMAGILLFTVLYSILSFDLSLSPFEDAAMLMRYATHVAAGQGIVWNIGERPVDGATDFLFMMVLAAFAWFGIALETAVRLIGIVSHLLTAAIIYIANRKIYQADRWMACLAASYLAFGVGLWYIVAYFGTPFFALSACVAWFFANVLIGESPPRYSPLAFAFSGLVMGLIRPEGVLLAIFMLCGIIYIKGLRNSVTIILYFLGTFLILGGVYFLWRWNYFGYPFPNPFYKKGGGRIYGSSLSFSATNAFILLLPLIPMILIRVRLMKELRQMFFFLIPLIGFICIWALLSNEMNYLMRFQYAILPIFLISWPTLFIVKGGIFNGRFGERFGNLSMCIAIIVIVLIVVFQREMYNRSIYFKDGRYDIAIILNEYKQKNYTIATTEAGLLPYYSEWKAIDTWGLNDQWIAHNGGVTEAYLDRYKPEVIVIHESQYQLMQPGENELWASMVAILKGYVEKNKYILAAEFGESPVNVHYYYVKSDFPDSQAITKQIRATEYYWYETGRKSINFSIQ
jgi:arabinofuranosyltransferase